MSRRTTIIAVGVIVFVVALIVAYFYSSFTGYFSAMPQAHSSSSQQNTQQVKLADSPYAPYAYLISSNTLSPEAQTALSGFKLQRQQLANGSLQIILQTSNSDYVNQSYILKPGEQLYFIEISFGDDNGLFDGSLSDDTAVVVDSNGYIVG